MFSNINVIELSKMDKISYIKTTGLIFINYGLN